MDANNVACGPVISEASTLLIPGIKDSLSPDLEYQSSATSGNNWTNQLVQSPSAAESLLRQVAKGIATVPSARQQDQRDSTSSPSGETVVTGASNDDGVDARNLPQPAAGPEPLLLLADVARGLEIAFKAERDLGFVLGPNQPPESFSRLSERVNRLLAPYSRQAHGLAAAAAAAVEEDWQRYVIFNPHHYLRHYVGGNADFEMILICWGPGQVSRIHNHQRSHCFLTVLQGELSEIRYVRKEPAHIQKYVLDDPQTTQAAGGQSGGVRVANDRGADSTDEDDDDRAGAPDLFLPKAVSPKAAPPPRLPRVLSFGGPCPQLDEISRAHLSPGDLAYINDGQALHSLGLSTDLYDQRFGPGAAAAATAAGSSSSTPSRGYQMGSVSLHIYSPPITRVTLYEPEEGRVILRQPGFFSRFGVRV